MKGKIRHDLVETVDIMLLHTNVNIDILKIENKPILELRAIRDSLISQYNRVIQYKVENDIRITRPLNVDNVLNF